MTDRVPAITKIWLGPGLVFLVLLTLLSLPGQLILAQAPDQPPGMCAGQKQVTEADMAGTLAIMSEIMEMGPELTPDDEETIIRSRGLTSERMNCILGKLMAGNDIFGWGSPGAYGVELSPDEITATGKFQKETMPLHKYLEEGLNISLDGN